MLFTLLLKINVICVSLWLISGLDLKKKVSYLFYFYLLLMFYSLLLTAFWLFFLFIMAATYPPITILIFDNISLYSDKNNVQDNTENTNTREDVLVV